MASAKKANIKAQKALQAGDYGRAEQILSAVNADPASRSLDNLILQGRVLAAQQKIPQAVAALEMAESQARQPAQKVKILNMLADLLCGRPQVSENELIQAIGYLERCVALDSRPTNARARKNLCALYYRMMNFRAVDKHAEQLLAVPEFEIKAHLWLAGSGLFLGRKEQSEPHLLKAAEGAMAFDDGDLNWLIETLLNFRLNARAQKVIDDAVAAGRDNALISSSQARLFYEQKEYERVLEILTEEFVGSRQPNADAASFVYFMRGRSLDATGGYAEAHECFRAMNESSMRAYPAPIARDFTKAYKAVELSGLPVYELPESVRHVPVFMVGFPRSGTTLLDTILDTQDEIKTLSEIEGIFMARQEMAAMGRRYPEELPLLSREEVGRLREVYFAHVEPYLDEEDSCRVLIDKLPLNILHMPFIRMLFPDARFIFSLRHPLDVCLSCFQQGFKLNDEMVHFTGLESTFRRYRDVMSLFQWFRDEGDFNVLTVKYEDLVERFDETASEVFAFLNVEPDEGYKNFHAINRQKFSATPSRDQVVQPIYGSSRNRWKNYAEFIGPHIEIVRPFIDRFGYNLK